MIDLLEQNGFDCSLPSYFIWEGNTMYLPLDGTKQVLAELRSHVKRFRVSFDYMAESVISKTTGDPGITTLVESFANMGAPWLSGIKDVKSLARELGLYVVENFPLAELYQEYGVRRPMASTIFNYYAVCTLGHDSASKRQAA
jgi:O-methyltransferase involved in polyketide biosynthesis